ncbi:MAG: BON domain-containing protein [Candidatus Eremiobacter antarcticus]|nr:BON domain-containing protein [Candidatus Eremiobacteraeota bacterium]MBC5807392.1 BON domain-containing protein [Candidatus Eremiobacteraeota bacterium]
MRAWIVSVAIALLSALTSCTASQQQEAKTGVDDAWIATQVRTKIATIDAATVSLVSVQVRDRVVTLGGQVPSAQEHARVVEAARSVSGVKSVDDNLRVNPKAPTGKEIAGDLALQARVKAALASQTGVNAFAVKVSAHAGIVALDGSVPNKTVHDLVLETVRGVPGVRSIVDHIRQR